MACCRPVGNTWNLSGTLPVPTTVVICFPQMRSKATSFLAKVLSAENAATLEEWKAYPAAMRALPWIPQ